MGLTLLWLVHSLSKNKGKTQGEPTILLVDIFLLKCVVKFSKRTHIFIIVSKNKAAIVDFAKKKVTRLKRRQISFCLCGRFGHLIRMVKSMISKIRA